MCPKPNIHAPFSPVRAEVMLFARSLLLLLLCADASAQTTYIVKPDGVGSEDLATAISNAASGDIIELEDGVYAPKMHGQFAIKINKDVTLRAQNLGLATITGEGEMHATWRGPIGNSRQVIEINDYMSGNNINYVLIQGINIIDGLHYGEGGGLSLKNTAMGAQIIIDRCKFYGNRAGSTMYSGGAIHVQNAQGAAEGSSGKLVIMDTDVFDNAADCSGGAIYLASGHIEIIRCRIFNNVASPEGSVCQGNGGGIRHSQTSAVLMRSDLIDTEIFNNTARNRGGGIMIKGGSLMMYNATRIYDNGLLLNGADNTGLNALVTFGSAAMLLPVGPGMWVPNGLCSVLRAPCPLSGTVCPQNFDKCAVTADMSADSTTPVELANGVTCQQRLLNQPCDWQTSPQLLGKQAYSLPIGIPVDLEFPYLCAPGVLGSVDAEFQGSAACAGPCPAGYVCPTPATYEPQPCDAGSYCPEGSATSIPCPGGYWSAGGPTAVSINTCQMAPAGYYAPAGSHQPVPCPASGFYCPGTDLDYYSVPPGSKPIELDVGTMFVTEPRVVHKLIYHALNAELYNASSLPALAALYDVPESSITLIPQGTRMNVQIAASDGLTLSNITARMESVTTAEIDAAIEAATGETMLIDQSSTPITQQDVIEVVDCPPGSWCSAGNEIPCGNGTYNPDSKQHSQIACRQCPDGSWSGMSSTKASDCTCVGGQYQHSIDLNKATGTPEPVCRECMVGTNCSANVPKAGFVLETLPVKPAFYRDNNQSTDVRRCPDAKANCSTTAGTWQCERDSTSGCRGSLTPTGCADGLTGPYCRLCAEAGELVHYVAATDKQVAHCETCGSKLVTTISVGVIVLAALPFVYLLLVKVHDKLQKNNSKALKRMAYINATFKPANKGKIIIGFYMIATKTYEVYEVELPADVSAILVQLSSFITLGVKGFSATSVECMGLTGYVPRLLFWMLVPPVIVGLVVGFNAIAMFVSARMAKRSERAVPQASLFERSLPLVLKAMFLVYPVVTQVAFESFPCYEFDNGASAYLKADVNIDCNADEYGSAKGLAWIAIILYPIGLWMVNFVLLMKCRRALLAGQETSLTRATAFLHKEYDPICFWWELAEMARRFILVGLFVTFQPGKIIQIGAGTIVCGVYLLVQLQAKPYKVPTDDLLASASSFSLLMVFLCSVFYKYAALTNSEELQEKMSQEQKDDYITSSLTLSFVLILSVLGSILAAAGLACAQVIGEMRARMKLRLIKYASNGKEVVCKVLTDASGMADAQAFHLFLSHAWPAAQDRMRIVKERFAEALPSAKVFLDVDDLKSGSGTAEVDKSECILVFTTTSYFTKKNSMKELYRAVVQRRPILAMLEPDMTQEGGLTQAAITEMLTSEQLDGVEFKWLKKQYSKWALEGALAPNSFDHAPSGAEVAASLFAVEPVEWNRLPHFQDVTIRLIAERGILHGEMGKLYLQGEAASIKVDMKPSAGSYHLYVSPHNAGAEQLAAELKGSSVLSNKQWPLMYTANLSNRSRCDHMLVLLDDRTWTSGETTAKLIEEIESGMETGVHMLCVHEFPSVVGPPRHACDFGLMFRSDWTPDHLQSGATNLYKEIAIALKGAEYRTPGLVAVASKIAATAAPIQAGHSTHRKREQSSARGQGKGAGITIDRPMQADVKQGDLNA